MDRDWSGRSRSTGPLHDPVTWYGITHAGEQGVEGLTFSPLQSKGAFHYAKNFEDFGWKLHGKVPSDRKMSERKRIIFESPLL